MAKFSSVFVAFSVIRAALLTLGQLQPQSGSSSTGGQTGPTSGQVSGGSALPGSNTVMDATTNPETLAINYLLSAYPGSTLTRPSPPWEISQVTINLVINSFDDIDDIDETMSFSGLVIVKWRDNYLKLPNTYQSVEYVHLRYKDVWLPLFIQSSAADTVSPILNADTNGNSDVLRADRNGNVVAVAAGKYVTQCTLDLTLFPFDSQSCSYSFQGWGYTYDLLSLVADDPAYSATDENSLMSSQWQIIDIANTSEIAYFMSDPYSCLTYTITAKRRPNFYVLNVLLPCVLMTILALTTFLFPLDTSRASYAITVVLGFAVYQLLIVQALPQTATRISLVLFIISEMVIASFIALHSILLAWLVQRYSTSGDPLSPTLAGWTCLRQRKLNQHRLAKAKLSSHAPEVQASARLVNKLESDRVDRSHEADWIHFFNMIDVLVMFLCVTVAVGIPVLIFYTSTFSDGDSSVSSPVETNYFTRFYEITTPIPQPPGNQQPPPPPQ